MAPVATKTSFALPAVCGKVYPVPPGKSPTKKELRATPATKVFVSLIDNAGLLIPDVVPVLISI